MKRNSDPFWWGLFGAGGAISALFLPALLFLNGLAIPLGWIASPRYSALLTLVKHPFTRLFLFGLISLSLFHWAHRFRYTLYDGLQVKHLKLVAIICYGSAILVTLVAGYTLWSFEGPTN
jgi:fumarate reductase subunit D